MQADEIFEDEQRIVEERAANLGAAILTKPIRALKLRLPVTVKKDVSVRDAVKDMVENGVGCVLIEENDRLLGIFTERDILTKVIRKKLDLDATSVETVMTHDPECLSPESGIAYVLNKMSVGGFRHVPLVDDRGRPFGVVAMRNIVDYIVELFPNEVLNLPPEPGLSITRTREGA